MGNSSTTARAVPEPHVPKHHNRIYTVKLAPIPQDYLSAYKIRHLYVDPLPMDLDLGGSPLALGSPVYYDKREWYYVDPAPVVGINRGICFLFTTPDLERQPDLIADSGDVIGQTDAERKRRYAHLLGSPTVG